MKTTTQKGFAHLGIVLLLAVVAIVAFAGYKVVQNRSNSGQASSSIAKTAPAQVIPNVKNKADLNTVESALNSQNIDGNLNPDSLNNDVQSLL